MSKAKDGLMAAAKLVNVQMLKLEELNAGKGANKYFDLMTKLVYHQKYVKIRVESLGQIVHKASESCVANELIHTPKYLDQPSLSIFNHIDRRL